MISLDFQCLVRIESSFLARPTILANRRDFIAEDVESRLRT